MSLSSVQSDFRRMVAGKVRAQQLGAALRKAATDDEWWKILVTSAEREGWVCLSWTGGRSPRSQVLSSSPAVWSFRIPLGENEGLVVEGALGSAADSLDLITFADVLRNATPRARDSRPGGRGTQP